MAIPGGDAFTLMPVISQPEELGFTENESFELFAAAIYVSVHVLCEAEVLLFAP